MKLFVVVMDLSGGPCFSRPLLLHIHDKMAALIGFHECKKERRGQGEKREKKGKGEKKKFGRRDSKGDPGKAVWEDGENYKNI